MLRNQRRFLNYFFIGPPGSGKSTIANVLAREITGYSHVDTDRDILQNTGFLNNRKMSRNWLSRNLFRSKLKIQFYKKNRF